VRHKNAVKLLAFVDADNNPSIMLHERLSFTLSENQGAENVYAGGGRIVYEYAI